MDTAMAALEEVQRDVEWGLYNVCDCGHRLFEHQRALVGPGEKYYELCIVPGCACTMFSDTDLVADEYARAKAADERERAELAEAAGAADVRS